MILTLLVLHELLVRTLPLRRHFSIHRHRNRHVHDEVRGVAGGLEDTLPLRGPVEGTLVVCLWTGFCGVLCHELLEVRPQVHLNISIKERGLP